MTTSTLPRDCADAPTGNANAADVASTAAPILRMFIIKPFRKNE